ncbi:type-F conjugative transfer system pilin assembly protein TrbC [Neisseria sp. Ec49-e6-T10]|uniref:type-F conjugative transfer system pilin assembly protein TrbC n=1 Tax=Neisseria sp. Ec49-e6-T10 TaxID=3140744 RepID=UPI003EB90115
MNEKTIFFQSNRKKKIIGSLLALFVLAFCGVVAVANTLTPEEASKRAKEVIEQIEPTKGTNIPNTVPQNPNVPDHRATGVKVPELADYGQDKGISVDPMEVAERYKARTIDSTLKNETDLLVFVSFSMPEASLMRIASEAKKTGAILVLRGFKNGSMKETVAASQNINGLGAQVMIHPELFTQFNVVDVPTFALAKTSDELSGCANDEQATCTEHYVIKGDVSLHAVLEKFEENKTSVTLSDAAATRLASLEGQQ